MKRWEPREPGNNLLERHEILAYRDQEIWRYMNLAKFISMLNSKSLYFSRLDQFDDRHEGALSKPALERVVLESMDRSRSRRQHTEPDDVARERAIEVEAATTKVKSLCIITNCWNASSVESAAMWANYGQNGVAIRSTIGSLYDCTRGYDPPVMIQPVYYVDHGVQDMDPEESFLFKHQLYEYEQEIRALILFKPGTVAPTGAPIPIDPINPTADLRTLIHGIHLAPRAGSLQREVIELLLSRFELQGIDVIASAADTIPDYRVQHDRALAGIDTATFEKNLAEFREKREPKKET